MKTIGLIGGMSWESTIHYYAAINEYFRDHLGGLHSAKIILHSVDFDEIEKLQSSGQWEKCGDILGRVAEELERCGADLILICTNTIHKVYAQIQSYVRVPILHIADATADALHKDGRHRVALLGTKYTITEDFYRKRLEAQGFEILVPEAADIELVNSVIFKELCVGKMEDHSRQEFSRIISGLKEKGADAVILGCTEIGMLIKAADSVLPIYDTTLIHAEKAAELAL